MRGAILSVPVLIMLGATNANALPILDFEGIVATGSIGAPNAAPVSLGVDPYLVLQSSGNDDENHFLFASDRIYHNATGFNGNGNSTSLLGWCGSCDVLFHITSTEHAFFSIYSMDFGGLGSGEDPGLIDVVAHLYEGGTIVRTIDPRPMFATYVLNFVKVTGVEFGLRLPGVDAAVDNIAPFAPVPEPSTLWLFGVGVSAFVVVRRRKSPAE
jgi:hypothetical protein